MYMHVHVKHFYMIYVIIKYYKIIIFSLALLEFPYSIFISYISDYIVKLSDSK